MSTKNWFKKLSLLALTVLATTGCSKQGFIVNPITSPQQTPGNFIVPPKVDILLAEDDTGSISEAYSSISQQLPLFLDGMEKKGWDYHFATIPLTTERPIDQILVSKHDPNWGDQWVSPFPGADPTDLPGAISSAFFHTPATYTRFINHQDISNSRNGDEPGLENISNTLQNIVSDGGFLREDALLVVLVVGNGNDNSNVAICQRSDGFRGPCDLIHGEPVCRSQDGTDGLCSAMSDGIPLGTMTLNESFTHYKDLIAKTKDNSGLVKFYSAVAGANYSNCLGGRATTGTRYQQMSAALGGQSFDVCAKSLSSVLDSVTQSLQKVKIAFRTRYLFVDREPDPSSIQVRKFRGGDQTTAEVIPQDPINGWTYAGNVENVYTVDYPIEMNQASGWAIELHGKAKLVGDDVADVTFSPAGAANSSNR